MTVRVEGVDHSPFEGVKVYAFDSGTYKGYSGTTGKDGQVTFTMPQGNYHFRGDLNGTQFCSGGENHCVLPGCTSASVTLPGGNTSRSTVTINYTYDGLSRLTAGDYRNGDYYIAYKYSGLGDRIQQTVDGTTTNYTLDINTGTGLTQVLDDGTNKYLYGNQRIAQIAPTQTGYFLPDALGSMRQMTDSSAALTLARSYDPYGNGINSSGTGETVFGYIGEM